MKLLSIIFFALLSVAMVGCSDDEFNGLTTVDPAPANGVTFPDATVNNFTLMDDNAFIIQQNSVANGEVLVRIKGPSNKAIVSVEAKAQRFRAAIVWPNVSPTVPTASTSTARVPSGFTRTSVANNLGVTTYEPASEVNYTLSLGSFPASLTNGTLGAVRIPPTTSPTYDVIRFYFIVTYDDGSSIFSNEVRVVVVG
jgi:hypothetical protein